VLRVLASDDLGAIRGIRAEPEVCARHLAAGAALISALVPLLGHDVAARIASDVQAGAPCASRCCRRATLKRARSSSFSMSGTSCAPCEQPKDDPADA
jgi:aspartate ammonia-lyase